MFCGKRDVLLRIILTCSIGVVSILGDKGLKYGKTSMLRAIFDNLTHAIVGGLSWALILNLSRKSLLQNLNSIFLCFSLSSFVDVDHFVSARSWKLTDATHLEKRPFLHCTTVPILAWLILILSASVFNCPRLAYYAWIISASFLSHHIRDATRRGFWFCHFGTTQPIPYHMYISLSMALPYILHWFMTLYSSTPKSSDNITTIDIV